MTASNSKYSNIKILHLKKPNQLELAYHVRREVYVVEQGYLPNVVTDEDDADAEHWAAVADRLFEDGSVEPNHSIGTIRLVRISENVARLGRVAVLSNARGLGIGPKLITEFIDYCRANGYHTIYLHAVSEKRGFYEKLGFVVEDGDSEEFEEDGTPHIRLWKRNVGQQQPSSAS
ncbi:acyl-CoA N-acyltransferase [Mucor lusitanicus]|uniref:Acyl-CoA N-acyltransferase n=1 Tax=Mucor circinelloides f. lusitanicus TaxID=29924 RepID=A0A8H4BSQ8_MUCCL|nr:acyl-CoA N-acyltransferase [Mucor lusitanicus]